MRVSRDDIYLWLEEVKDPEIPVLSVIDLGILRNVETHDDESVTITITPTFVGCPALEMMKSEIIEKLRDNGIYKVKVDVNYKNPWSSEDISEKGRKALSQFGIAPPPVLFTDLDILEHAQCPRCEGKDTEMHTLFGSTLCRSMHYCHNCKEAFEHFKPV